MSDTIKLRSEAIRSKLLVGILLLVIAVVYGLMGLWTPLAFDDLGFQEYYCSFNGGSERFSLSAWIDYALFMRDTDNGRFANILTPMSTLYLPHWLNASFIGVFTAMLFLGILKLASPAGRRGTEAAAYGLAVVWLLALLALPWRDKLFFVNYSYNYQLSGCLVVWFLYIVCCGELLRRLPSIAVVFASLLGFVAGGMHDGFSLPVAGGLVIWAVINRFRMSRRWWILVGCFFAGTAVVVSSPAEWARAGRELHPDFDFHIAFRMLKRAAVVFPLVWGMLAAAAISLLRPEWRTTLLRWFRSQRFVVLVVMMIGSLFIGILTNCTPRYGFAGEMAAIVLVWMFAGRFCGRIAGVVSMILILSIMIPTLVAQRRIFCEDAMIRSELAESETGTVFLSTLAYSDLSPFPSVTSMSALLLQQPSAGIWGNVFQIYSYNRWLRRQSGRSEASVDRLQSVVPADLLDFTADKALLLPVASWTQMSRQVSLSVYRGFLLSDDFERARSVVTAPGRMMIPFIDIEFTDKSGNIKVISYDYTPFIASDGTPMVLLGKLPFPLSEIASVVVIS